MRFGRLAVLEMIGYHICPGRYKCKMWRCKCDCGNDVITRGKSLSGGVTKSCGCLRDELQHKRVTKHGDCKSRLYSVWDSMRQRCNNPNNSAYKNYGGRGISICEEWDDYSSFKNWAIDSGFDDSAERGECTLDRIDVNGDYCPENCRWVSMKIQSANRRNSLYLELNGVRKSLIEWAEDTGIKYQTLVRRFKNNLTPEEILKKI